MKLLPLILISLITQVHSGGVLVYKDANQQGDASAKATYYSSISTDGLATWVIIGGRRVGFDSLHFHEWIEIQSALPNELVTNQQILEFRAYATSVRRFSDRFARARSLMKATVDSVTDAVAKLDSGQLRVNADWVTKVEYDAIQLAAKGKEQALLKKIEDRKRGEEQTNAIKDLEKNIRWSPRPVPEL